MANLAVCADGSERLRIVERLVDATVDANAVGVRMLLAPINPADLLVLDGQYAFQLNSEDPLGAEGMGMVDTVGAAVHDLKPGDIVLPLSRGNWCSYRIVDRSALIPLPPGIDPAQAAMLRINPATALLLLNAAQLVPGDVLVQNAAGSAVACWVRLLAARKGVHVLDVVRMPDAALPQASVDGPDLAEQLQISAQGRPIRAALDCVAGDGSGRLAACLAPQGRVIVFGHLSRAPIQVASTLLTGKGISITGFSLRPAESLIGPAAVADMFADIVATFLTDAPLMPIRAVMPMKDAEAAVALARSPGPGKVLLDLAR